MLSFEYRCQLPVNQLTNRQLATDNWLIININQEFLPKALILF